MPTPTSALPEHPATSTCAQAQALRRWLETHGIVLDRLAAGMWAVADTPDAELGQVAGTAPLTFVVSAEVFVTLREPLVMLGFEYRSSSGTLTAGPEVRAALGFPAVLRRDERWGGRDVADHEGLPYTA